MAIFKVTATDGKKELIVRAPCLSCARKHAAETMPAKEFKHWVNATVSVVVGSRHNGNGPTVILEYINHE